MVDGGIQLNAIVFSATLLSVLRPSIHKRVSIYNLIPRQHEKFLVI